MKITAHIRRTSDGIIRVYHDDYEWDEEGAWLYQWVDGNYACDCNRALFFAHVAGEPDPENTPCGQDAYTLKLLNDDGDELHRDEGYTE